MPLFASLRLLLASRPSLSSPCFPHPLEAIIHFFFYPPPLPHSHSLLINFTRLFVSFSLHFFFPPSCFLRTKFTLCYLLLFFFIYFRVFIYFSSCYFFFLLTNWQMLLGISVLQTRRKRRRMDWREGRKGTLEG